MFRFSSLALVAALGFAAALHTPARAASQVDELSLLALDNGGDAPAGEDGPRHRRPHADGQDGDKGERGGMREHMHERILHALLKDITLDDGQKAELKKIQDDNHAKREAFEKEHKDELKKFGDSMKAWYESHKADFESARKAMRDAHESGDKDAIQKARDSMKKLAESRPKMPDDLKAGMLSPEQAEAQIRAILKGDQVKTFDENLKRIKDRMKDGAGFGPPPGGEGNEKHGEGHRRPHKDGGGDQPAPPPPPPPAN